MIQSKFPAKQGEHMTTQLFFFRARTFSFTVLFLQKLQIASYVLSQCSWTLILLRNPFFFLLQLPSSFIHSADVSNPFFQNQSLPSLLGFSHSSCGFQAPVLCVYWTPVSPLCSMTLRKQLNLWACKNINSFIMVQILPYIYTCGLNEIIHLNLIAQYLSIE